MEFIIGFPKCNTTQRWPLLEYPNSGDKLVLMDDGKLRHYTSDDKDHTKNAEYDEIDEKNEQRDTFFHDYIQGQYCYDRVTTIIVNILFTKLDKMLNLILGVFI